MALVETEAVPVRRSCTADLWHNDRLAVGYCSGSSARSVREITILVIKTDDGTLSRLHNAHSLH